MHYLCIGKEKERNKPICEKCVVRHNLSNCVNRPLSNLRTVFIQVQTLARLDIMRKIAPEMNKKILSTAFYVRNRECRTKTACSRKFSWPENGGFKSQWNLLLAVKIFRKFWTFPLMIFYVSVLQLPYFVWAAVSLLLTLPDQGGQNSLWKNPPKCSQTHYLSN
jgi:hypothetical protein